MMINDDAFIAWLNVNLSNLSHLQQRIFSLRYGLNGEERHSLQEIQAELMLSVDRIRAEEAEVLVMIRQEINKNN